MSDRDKALDSMFVVAMTLLEMEPDEFFHTFAKEGVHPKKEPLDPGLLMEARDDLCSVCHTGEPDQVRIQRVPMAAGEGREVMDHRVHNPRQFCQVFAGEPNRGGAPVVYRIQIEEDAGSETEPPATHFIRFQDGHPKDGYNGILDSALLAVLIDRQLGFVGGPWPSEEGKKALFHLQEALKAMDSRVADRVKRGVMNTDNK